MGECTCYSFGMATQARKRPTVSLTLDPEIRAAADELLAQLPGRMSLSELVDELLGEFVTTVGPMVKQVVEASPLDRVNTLHQLAGQQMFAFGKEYAETVEYVKQLEAARALQEEMPEVARALKELESGKE